MTDSPNPFDPAALRLDQSYADTVGVPALFGSSGRAGDDVPAVRFAHSFDARRRFLLPRQFRQSLDGMLGGRIQAHVGRRQKTEHGTDVDDPTLCLANTR